MSDYEFTNDWFARDAAPVWRNLLPQIRPSRILEVGSYEGASACFAIESCAGERPLELHCIDTWDGGVEHQSGGLLESDMGAVEARFHRNIEKAKLRATHPANVIIHRGRSEGNWPVSSLKARLAFLIFATSMAHIRPLMYCATPF